jgi:predicted lipoprotein with Yx(FWY)xxD motif
MKNRDMGHQQTRGTTPHRLRRRVVGASLGVVAVAGAMAVMPAMSAQATSPTKQKVVEVVTRAPYGMMLATRKGASLYTASSPCKKSCLSAWPPLLLATGKTIPTGTTGLGTVALMFKGNPRLQVTFDGKALYRFVGDSGTSVNGNGIAGFMVAEV